MAPFDQRGATQLASGQPPCVRPVAIRVILEPSAFIVKRVEAGVRTAGRSHRRFLFPRGVVRINCHGGFFKWGQAREVCSTYIHHKDVI